jgi:hypothetical protein
MAGLSRSVKCIIVNDTEVALTATDTQLNFKLEHGSFDGGIAAPPWPIPAHATVDFTTSTAGLLTGTEGWVCYALEGINIVVMLSWKEPFTGDNAYGVTPNVLPTATRELDPVDLAFTDRDGVPLSLDQATAADDVVVTYTIRLKPDPATAPKAQPAITEASPIAAKPMGTMNISAVSTLPDWAKNLSPKRKKMFAVLATLLPQSVDAAGSPPYGQGGKFINSNDWWTRTNTTTSCTSFNPKAMKAYFAPGKCPFENQWAFTTGGNAAWVQETKKDGKTVYTNNSAHSPQPGWKLFKANSSSLPKPGDTYNLWADFPSVGASGKPLPAGMRHVGIVCYVPDPSDPNDCWVTADGGQGKGTAQECELVHRSSVPRTPKNPADGPANTPHFGGGAEGMKEPLPRLVGWVDLEDASFGDFDTTFSDEAFNDLVARIEKVRAFFKANKK